MLRLIQSRLPLNQSHAATPYWMLNFLSQSPKFHLYLSYLIDQAIIDQYLQRIQFNIKTPMMQQVPFSFHYYLDLGNSKISPIFINQQSDPYIEASKLCAKEHLPSILVTIIGDAIKNQMDQERNLASSHITKPKNTHSEQFYSENTASMKELICISDTLNTELKDDLVPNAVNPPSATAKQNISSKSKEKANVFDHLYNNYKKIEQKKELSRKKSFEAIPFRPQINNLSKKIVQNKRMMEEYANCSLPKSSNKQLQTCESKPKPKISIRVFHQGENQGQSVYNRSSQYSRKSQEKRKKMRESIEQKLMESCSFRPKINAAKYR